MKILVEKAVIEQALEALIKANHFHDYEDEITALREALAEQEDEIYWIETNKALAKEIIELKRQAEQEPVLCVECGQPVMHIGNKCYACCQKATEELENALKASAPVQQAEQEPVAWMVYTADGQSVYVTDNPTDIKDGQRALPPYTAPQPVKEVELTDDEIANAMELPLDDITCVELEDARAVIAAYKEKQRG